MSIVRVNGALGRAGGALGRGGGGDAYIPGAKAILTPSDLTLLGRYRVPSDAMSPDNPATNPNWCRFGFSRMALTGRYVDGELRLLCTMSQVNWGPLAELVVNAEPTMSTAAPILPLHRNHGSPYVRTRVNTDPNNHPIMRGLYWDEQNQMLLYSWHPGYDGSKDRTIGAITFTGEDGGVAAFAAGPWRTSVHPKRANACMTKVPQTFADTYLTGHTVAIGAVGSSVNAASPWGATFHAFNPSNLLATPASSYSDQNDTDIPVTSLVDYTISNKMPRNTNWFSHAPDELDESVFSSIDNFQAMSWIENTTKRGLVCFAGIMDVLAGYDYTVGGLIPGETLPHFWYTSSSTCIHGQTGLPVFEATGPGTPTYLPELYIFDPDDFADVIAGTLNKGAVTPVTSHVQLAVQYGSTFPDRLQRFWGIGQSWYDESTRRLYLPINMIDTTRGTLEPKPYIYVFDVAD